MKVVKFLPVICLIGLLALLSGCGLFNAVFGSGTITTLSEPNTGFTSVSLADACTGTVTCGAAFSVTIRMDDNLTQYLRVTQSGGTLTIDMEPNHSYRNMTFQVDITLPVLENLSLADATTGTLSGFSAAGAVTLNVADASVMTVNSLNASSVSVSARDASTVNGSIVSASLGLQVEDASHATLSGNTTTMSITVKDASSATLSSLSALNASVNVRDASNARVSATGTLSGSVTDASSLRYAGSPSSVSVSHDISSSVGPM
jgi:hypothetical protein